MKIEIESTRDMKTNNHQQQPPIGKRDDAARPANPEKPNTFVRPMFVITGVALCMGLVSCVVPYDSQGDGSVSVTRYSPGYRVNSLPGGYRSENISGSTYYYHDGYYYRPGSGGYVVVDAPRTSRYYDDYSRRQQTYQPSRDYRESSNRHDPRYDRGEVMTRLPDGYRVVKHRGNEYYQVGDRYYRRQNDTYVIVSSPY
jgi:hypothetical protein